MALALPFLSIGWALVRLYRDPAVFAFDPFGGYFPGPIYDEALRPPLRLLWYRLANLTWAATWIAVAVWLRPRPTEPLRLTWRPWWRPISAAVLLGASWLWFSSEGNLGVHVTHADLAQRLPRETRTQHFVLRTDLAAESDEEVARAAEDLEFRYHQLRADARRHPHRTVRVYRFPSAAAKKDAVGAGGTLFAKPWTREIFVQAERFPAQRLRHELAHVFAGAFGDRWFGIALAWRFWGPLPVPRLASGLVEGLAEAVDFTNPGGRSTTHEEAAAMLALGQAPPLARALGAGFTAEAGPRAYTIAGSFCRFLLDRFGAAKLRALYQSAGDFPAVYGRELGALEQEWRAFLSSLPVDERRPGRGPGGLPPAGHLPEGVRARAGGARGRGTYPPRHGARRRGRVARAHLRRRSRRAYLPSGPRGGPGRGWPAGACAGDAAGAGRSRRTLTRPLRARAANLEAGIHFRAGRLAEAENAVRQALAAATEDADERFAVARRRALRDPEDAGTLGRVFFGDERGRSLDPGLLVYLLGEFARQNPDEALGPYLLARQLVTRDPKLAVSHLRAACPFDEAPMAAPLDPTFLPECRRLLGETAYLSGELSAARVAFTWLAEHADREADRLRAQDWLERIAWRTSQPTPMLQPPGPTDGTTSPHDRTQVPPR